MSAEARSAVQVGPSPTAWRAAVAPYIGPDASRSILQLSTTLALLALSFTVAYQLLDWSVWAGRALAPVSGGGGVGSVILIDDS